MPSRPNISYVSLSTWSMMMCEDVSLLLLSFLLLLSSFCEDDDCDDCDGDEGKMAI